MNTPKVCLVVDDDKAVRAYVTAVLKREYFQIIQASDGIEALRLVENLGNIVDLIISDIRMVGCDGITFVCAARKMFPKMPVVLISCYGEAESPRFRKCDFEFVPKPFKPATLLHAVDEASRMTELRMAATAAA